MLHFALRRAHNVHWQALDVDKAARARAQGPAGRACSGSPASPAPASRRSPTWSRSSCTRWAATPTCSTATTCATASTRTSASPTPTASRTSAASPRSRKLMVDAGLIVLVSFISPFRAERRMARELVARRRVHRGLRRHAARGGRGARPQGPLQEGAARRARRTSPASTRPTRRPRTPEIRIDTTSAQRRGGRRRRCIARPERAARPAPAHERLPSRELLGRASRDIARAAGRGDPRGVRRAARSSGAHKVTARR